jgi:hypothetical protein
MRGKRYNKTKEEFIAGKNFVAVVVVVALKIKNM